MMVFFKSKTVACFRTDIAGNDNEKKGIFEFDERITCTVTCFYIEKKSLFCVFYRSGIKCIDIDVMRDNVNDTKKY
jgi:hypothetical protein